MFVRLAKTGDLDGLVKLLDSVDGSLTTLPKDRKGMLERLEACEKSLAEPGDQQSYLFVLEEDGEITGLSAIYTGIGLDRPFYNFRVSNLTKSSPELGLRAQTDLLSVVNDYTGTTELGTLFLHPAKRGGGRGRLLSWARLVFMACHHDRFSGRVFAELRGKLDDNGQSPFWNALGRHFFNMEFDQADRVSGTSHRFISDMMPTYPIYTCLLPRDAQDAIAQINKDAGGAAGLLKTQGLRYSGLVDIFDAGLCIDAHLDNIRISQELEHAVLEDCEGKWAGKKGLVCNKGWENFRVLQSTSLMAKGNRLKLPENECAALDLAPNSPLAFYLM